MPQPTVFVSYSHRDEEEKEELVAHLGVLPNVDLWRDDRIGAGGDWEQEITEAMDRASVAILLITANFLNSGFIKRKEVPRLLEHRASEGLTVFPVIAKACAWEEVPWLTKMNVKPKNGTPVWRASGIHVDEYLAAITKEVAAIIREQERQAAIEEHLNAARTALEEGAFSKANHLLDAILEEKGLDPGNPEAQRLRSEVERQEKLSTLHRRSAEATDAARIVEINKEVERQEKLSTLHRRLARLKTPAKIVELSEQILKLEPGDQDAQSAKAEAQRQLDIAKYRKEATKAFRKAEYEGAIAAWERLLDLEPEDEAAKAGLEEAEKQQDIRDESAIARSVTKDGDRQAALDAWKRVLEVEPDHVEAQEGAEEAQRQLDIRGHRQGAKGAFAKREYDKAIALWNKLLELEPDDKEAKAGIARIQDEIARRDLFMESWSEAERAVEANMIKTFRDATDRLTKLFCEALTFKRVEDSAFLGQFYGRLIDASNLAFQLNVRPEFPLIYACKTVFSEEDVNAAFGLLDRFQIYADYFALLIAFRDPQALRQQVRESAYKNDFIVLDRDQFWEILAANSPIQSLTDCILEQIDLVSVSPYTVGGPVSEKIFFGRAAEEKTLRQNIPRNDYALLANRKVGKTSLLNKVAPLLNRVPHYQVFYCDLQAVSDYESFYEELVVAYPEFEGIGNLNEPSPLDFRKVINSIKQNNNNRQIILIFDEVNELLKYDLQFKERLSKTFRSLSQRENVRFIFSGTTTLVKRVHDPDSPFFNFCEPLKIELLNKKADRELVTVPMRTLNVKFENASAIVQRILAITACHPNMIQCTCAQLIKRINEKQQRTITEADLDMVIASQEFYEYFEGLIWGQATAMEKVIVYVMWSYREFTKVEVIAEFTRRGLPIENVEASLETLQIYSILSRKNGKYTFTYSEFAKLMGEHDDIDELAADYQQEVLKT